MSAIKNPSKYLGSELKYLSKVLEGEAWSATIGSWAHGLEEKFASLIGMRYGVAANSGTSALHMALEAVGVKAGDEVISPAITVIMDSTATIHANAIPVYCDVDEKTFLLDPKDFERKITPKTKAVIVVSLYGSSPDYDAILNIAHTYGIAVIEDNAQAVLSEYKGKTLGSIGDISCFSFENSKHISCGEGGLLLTDNEEYAEKARKLGGHGFRNLKADEGRVRFVNKEMFQNPFYKRHDSLGWNYRMPEFTAAVACAQLERVDELVELRKKTAEIFMDVMRDCDYLTPQENLPNTVNSYYALGVVYDGEQAIGVPWADFRREYVEMGGDGFYGAWSVPYLEPLMVTGAFKSRLPEVYANTNYVAGLCPIAEKVQPKIMQFKTNYRDLTLAEQKADVLRRLINGRDKRK